MCLCEIQLTPIGLLLDMLGIVLLFIYGLPSKIEKTTSGVGLQIEEGEIIRIKAKNKTIHFWSYFGLGLLILGFFLQFFDSVLPYILLCDCGCQ